MRKTRKSKSLAPRSGQATVSILLFVLAAGAVFLAHLARLPLQAAYLVVLGFIVFFTAFVKPDFALIILLFSMLLSPEFKTGAVSGREVVIRADDILLIIIFVGWLARMAVYKEIGLLKTTPVNRPLLIFLGIYLVATLYGILRQYVSLTSGVFYFLKYLEYFLIFFMVTNNLKSARQLRMFVYAALFVALIVSLFAWSQHGSGIERVTAPFEGKVGEANTLGGYLVIMLMVAAGIFLHAPRGPNKIFLGAVILLAFPALLFTLSRGSWLAFLLAFLVLLFLTRKGKAALAAILVFMILLSPFVMPKYVQKRIQYTFTPETQYTVMGKHVGIDESTAARVDNWKYGLQAWSREPVIGHGAGSAGPVVDNQYTRILIETGIIGFCAFMWLIISLYRNSLAAYVQAKNDYFASGLAVGFIAGLAGLLAHSLSAASFIIIRIMEPFWFLAALAIMAPQLEADSDGQNNI